MKRALMIMAILTASLVLMGRAVAADLTLRLAHEAPPTHPKGVWAQDFAEALAQTSEGRIEVQVFPQGQLYKSPRAAIEAVIAGQLQIAIPSTGYMASIEPSFEVIDLPMLFANQKALYRFEDSQVASELLSKIETKGMKGLGFVSNASLDLFSKEKMVVPADFSGKKVRAHSAMLEETVKALGGNPVSMPGSELYLALQQGVVDGAFTTVTYGAPNNYNEVADYLTRAAVSSIAYPVVANLDFWNSLSAADRDAIEKAVEIATKKNRANLGKIVDDAVASLKNGGISVVELTDAQHAEWQDALAPIYKEFADRVSGDLVERVKAVK